MISREQAAQIAADALRLRSVAGTFDIGKVVTLKEITWRRPSAGYAVGPDIFSNGWIVYLHPKEMRGLTASTIAVVSRETGHVQYFGSANDEG